MRDGLLALAEQLGRASQCLEPIGDELGGRLTGDRLDPPQPGADARLAGDQQQADLPGRGDVRAAAQLLAEPVDLDDAHRLGDVLLPEEHVGAERLGLLDRHELGRDRRVPPDLGIHDPLDLAQRLARRRGGRRKVEAQPFGADPRAGLLRALAEHVAQRPMQQMGARVVPRGRPAPVLVDLGAHRVADAQRPFERPEVDDRVTDALGIGHGEASVRTDQLAAVADLAAALGVERRPIEHDRRRLTRNGGEHAAGRRRSSRSDSR